MTKEKGGVAFAPVTKQIALTQCNYESGDKLNVLMFSLAQFFVF